MIGSPRQWCPVSPVIHWLLPVVPPLLVRMVSFRPAAVPPESGVGVVATSDVARLLGAAFDELAHERLLPDTARHSVGAGQRDG